MQRTRRKLAAILPTIAILAAIGTAASRPFPDESKALEQKEAKAWVEANFDRLPKTLEGVASLEERYRKPFVLKFDGSARVAFWREQMESFIKPRAELTPAQLTVVDAAGIRLNRQQIDFIRAAIDSLEYGVGVGDTKLRNEFSGRFCPSALRLFPKDVALKIFATAGPYGPAQTKISQASMIEGVTTALANVAVKLGLRQRLLPDCQCAINSVCGCIGGTCVYSDCNTSGTGCGCFFGGMCTGRECFPHQG